MRRNNVDSSWSRGWIIVGSYLFEPSYLSKLLNDLVLVLGMLTLLAVSALALGCSSFFSKQRSLARERALGLSMLVTLYSKLPMTQFQVDTAIAFTSLSFRRCPSLSSMLVFLTVGRGATKNVLCATNPWSTNRQSACPWRVGEFRSSLKRSGSLLEVMPTSSPLIPIILLVQLSFTMFSLSLSIQGPQRFTRYLNSPVLE